MKSRQTEEDFEETGPEPTAPVPSLLPPRDVIDRLLFVDEFKDKHGKSQDPMDAFVDSIVSPELSCTRIINPDDLRFFRLMTNNIVDTWISTRPPYMNGFDIELLADKAQFRSEIKARRSLGPDRERVLLTGNPLQQPLPMEQGRPLSPWERLLGQGGTK